MSSLLSLLIVVIIIASSSYSVMDRVFQDQGRVPASFAQLASIQEMQDFKIQQYANVLNISPEEFYYSNHHTQKKPNKITIKLWL